MVYNYVLHLLWAATKRQSLISPIYVNAATTGERQWMAACGVYVVEN